MVCWWSDNGVGLVEVDSQPEGKIFGGKRGRGVVNVLCLVMFALKTNNHKSENYLMNSYSSNSEDSAPVVITPSVIQNVFFIVLRLW